MLHQSKPDFLLQQVKIKLGWNFKKDMSTDIEATKEYLREQAEAAAAKHKADKEAKKKELIEK